LPPLIDIPPPIPVAPKEEIVTYSKEVQTIPLQEEESDEDQDEIVRKRVEEELQKEIEKLRLEDELARQEESAANKQIETEIPGIQLYSSVDKVISEEEEQRILTSDAFHDFLSRSSKIVERALDEDYDVLVDYTADVEANQYVPWKLH
jgi:dynein intermediate chain, cytosolic